MMLFFIFIGACATAAFLAMALTAEAPVTARGRLTNLTDNRSLNISARSRGSDASFSERVVRPFFRAWAGAAEKVGIAGDTRVIQEKLEMAGRPQLFGAPMGVREYLGLKLVCLVLSVLAFLFLLRHPVADGTLGLLCTAVVTIGLYMIPTLIVDRRADARKHEIMRSMSDILDLLVVSAEAGLSLDAAMGRVAQRRSGPLAEEFEHALQEMRLGKSRAEALRGIARRTGVLEVKMFTSAIIQAENLGVSIAQVLRTQADTHRERRSQKLREAAAKLPVKMLFPMTFFILPAIFIVLAAPGMIQIMRSLKSMSR